MKSRNYSNFDRAILAFDSFLGNLNPASPVSARDNRPYPGESHEESRLNDSEKRYVSGLMRVNHAGEIAAQALYKAQALTSKSSDLKQSMLQSADEEIDHLDWCEARLRELDDHVSYLSPVWYSGSFGIGLIAGCFGDKWNLGFLAETEHQVVDHLDKHLAQLPKHDQRSRAILEQMRTDELQHAITAESAGANSLPKGVKTLMKLTSKIMTKTAYRI